MMNSVWCRCRGLGAGVFMSTVSSASWSASGCSVPDCTLLSLGPCFSCRLKFCNFYLSWQILGGDKRDHRDNLSWLFPSAGIPSISEVVLTLFVGHRPLEEFDENYTSSPQEDAHVPVCMLLISHLVYLLMQSPFLQHHIYHEVHHGSILKLYFLG